MTTQSKKLVLIILGLILEGAFFYFEDLFFGEMTRLFTSLSVEGIIGLLAIIGIIGAPIGIFFLYRDWSKNAINIPVQFAHLTVYYSKRGKQDYVTNNKTKYAYWVSDLLESRIKRHKIPMHHYKEKETLPNYLKTNGFTVFEKDPLPEELGLIYLENKSFILIDPPKESSNLCTKLMGHKLEDLQVVYLHRIDLRVILQGHISVHRVLLLKKSETWLAPDCLSELLKNGIIVNSLISSMHFWEDCNGWSVRNHYTFHPWAYPESELTKGL